MSLSNIYHASKSARTVKQCLAMVANVNRLEPAVAELSAVELRSEADRLRSAIPEGTKPLAAWTEELLAVIRATSVQVLGMRTHDVQLVGGLVLLQGKLAEMRTGEGKTLTIAAPCIVSAFQGKPVHVVTVNEYLAGRDVQTLRPLYEAMGLSVAVIRADQTIVEKQAAYACDVVYGVNHEYGFDYLRDNMVFSDTLRVQRGLGFVVIDEVDSVLIDEARTPLIVSGTAPDGVGIEPVLHRAVMALDGDTDFTVDEKEHTAVLTDAGYAAVEQWLFAEGHIEGRQALYKLQHLPMLQGIGQALLAQTLYRKDKQYVVVDGEIVIVDQATGRLMAGRRWGDGLHEAVEAKEGLRVHPRAETRATITYQNFFGLYEHLSGLTGTALTEAEEFQEIYGLDTVVVPTNRPVVRTDLPDLVFGTRSRKFEAIVAEVRERHVKGQPVLIGTGGLRDSEMMGALLTQAALPHRLLNARQNAEEASIIAQAGLPGAITVATNMAGRGTDIVLGGTAEVSTETSRALAISAGGLHVIGTERHDSRRVDNQLCGRAGRQGDVGSSQFFLSLDDKLLRVFAADRQDLLASLTEGGNGASHAMLDKVVAMAQQRLEKQGFDARRDLMKYDQVLASQRIGMYATRGALLVDEFETLKANILALAEDAVSGVCDEWLADDALQGEFDTVGFKAALAETFEVTAHVIAWVHQDELDEPALRDRILHLVLEKTTEWLSSMTFEEARQDALRTLDREWVDHLTSLEEIRASIGLRSMVQQNPVFAFSLEAKRHFDALRSAWAFALTQALKERARFARAAAGNAEASAGLTPAQAVELALFQRVVTRNEPCPCGSALRFKFCHGKPN